MKDPSRLLDSGTDEAELRLLRAGANEEPPTQALQRLAAELGLDAATSTSAKAAAATSKLQLAPFVLAAAGLALVGGAWIAARAVTRDEQTTAPQTLQPSAAPLEYNEPAQPAPGASGSLAREIAALDEVRSLLATDRAAAALTALSRYERELPRGALRIEASVLRIEAHQRAGQGEYARSLAERFLAEHPDSPHATRVRRLIGAATHAR
jgi:hypothetical protein